MAAEDEGGEPRPTVALLYQLSRAEFGEIRSRLDKLEGLPERVARTETMIGIYARLPDAVGGVERVAADHEHRILALERNREEDVASWRPHWPTLIAAGLALVAAIVVPIFT